MDLQEFPRDLQQKLEDIKEIRKEIAETYYQTGRVDDAKIMRLQVLIKQSCDSVFERFPVLFMYRADRGYIIPAPKSEKEIRFLEREGFQLMIPDALKGMELEKILELHRQNLDKYIPISHLFAVDAEYLIYLEAYLRSQENSFIKEKLENEGSVDVQMDSFIVEQRSEEFVSSNMSEEKKRRRKKSGDL
jgi:hypothetical protein